MESHGGLTGSQDARGRLDRISYARCFPGDCSEEKAQILRFSFKLGPEEQRIETQFARFIGGRVGEQPVVGDHVIINRLEDRVPRFRGIRNSSPRAFVESFAHSVRNIESVFLNDGESVGE